MIVILACYLLSALSLIWPTYQYMSSNNERRLEDVASAGLAVLLSVLWPLWAFLIVRKAYLTRLIGQSSAE